jgi:hypothetical protein
MYAISSFFVFVVLPLAMASPLLSFTYRNELGHRKSHLFSVGKHEPILGINFAIKLEAAAQIVPR